MRNYNQIRVKKRKLLIHDKEGNAMDIFEKLKSGEPVDMMSEEYRPVLEEALNRLKVYGHRGLGGF